MSSDLVRIVFEGTREKYKNLILISRGNFINKFLTKKSVTAVLLGTALLVSGAGNVYATTLSLSEDDSTVVVGARNVFATTLLGTEDEPIFAGVEKLYDNFI